MRFTRTRRGVQAKIEPVEASVLTQCASELLDLLGAADPVPEDPLAALVALPPTDLQPPTDPALGRLFPAAYSQDDEAAAEFRRYTEPDLRAAKRSSAYAVLADLEPLRDSGGKLTLDRDRADLWLAWLNDIRLVLGTRLEVTEDLDDQLDVDDPREPLLGIYGWLGWVQESLLACLQPRPNQA